MRKTTIYLPEPLRERIKRAAAEQGVSEAEIIRAAIDAYTSAKERPRPKLPLFAGPPPAGRGGGAPPPPPPPRRAPPPTPERRSLRTPQPAPQRPPRLRAPGTGRSRPGRGRRSAR